MELLTRDTEGHLHKLVVRNLLEYVMGHHLYWSPHRQIWSPHRQICSALVVVMTMVEMSVMLLEESLNDVAEFIGHDM